MPDETPGARDDDPRTEASRSSNGSHARPGAQIGPYRIVEKVGEGGFGTVYLAEQEEPLRRRVALKVIKTGGDDGQVVARFEAERQALALMSHTNIAAVLDAGETPDGQPFFVMEFVEGAPITHYCDHKKLDLGARLELFASVCRAIQHAHGKGVIHRDIKPSNVLVSEQDGRPVAKVIDFGIAKAMHESLTPKALHTDTFHILGTPAYMSPEQCRVDMLDIDTRTDVYSLGALLYELLTGRPPVAVRGVDSTSPHKSASGVEAVRPSAVVETRADADALAEVRGEPRGVAWFSRRLRGELDWITMKALEHERDARYETALELARDVEHHLRDEPVSAAPPGSAYRLRKFLRRNRVLVAATTAVLVALVGGLTLASWGLVEAQRERDRALTEQARAETEARKAEEVNRYLNDLLAAANPDSAGGKDVTVREVLDEAAARLDAGDLANETEVATALRQTLGSNYAALGSYDEAFRNLQEAVAAAESALQDEPGDPIRLAKALELRGEVEIHLGDHATALRTFQRAEEIREDRGQGVEQTANAVVGQARAYTLLDDYAAAELRLTNTLDSFASGGESAGLTRAMLLEALAQVLEVKGEYDRAIPLARSAIESYRKELPANHSTLAGAMNNLAATLEAAGRYEEAEQTHRAVLESRRRVLGDDHPEVANSLSNLGLVLYRLERFEEAESMQRESLRIIQATLPAGHFRLAINHGNLALALKGQKRLQEADRHFATALEIASRAQPAGLIYLAVTRANQADAWRQMGRRDRAESALLGAHADLTAALGAEHRRTLVVAEYLAELYSDSGEVQKSDQWRRRSIVKEPEG